MQSLFGSAIVIYLEKLIVQSVKSSFHQTALKDRIEENARALWALDKLAAAKRPQRRARPAFRGFGHSRGPSVLNTPAPSRPPSRAASPERMESYDRLQPIRGRPGEAIVEVPLTPRGDRLSFSISDRPANLRQRPSKVTEGENVDVQDKDAGGPDAQKDLRSTKHFWRKAHSRTIADQVMRIYIPFCGCG